MKYLLAIAFFIWLQVLSGCGRSVDPTFQPYVDSFKTEAAAQMHPVNMDAISIQFGPVTESDAYAQCVGQQFVGGMITVNASLWHGLTEAHREQIMFHELGHCVLLRAHRTDLRADGSPISIMYPVSNFVSSYVAHRSEYIKELFDTP